MACSKGGSDNPDPSIDGQVENKVETNNGITYKVYAKSGQTNYKGRSVVGGYSYATFMLYTVNTTYHQSLANCKGEGGQVIMRNGNVLDVSKRKKSDFLQAIGYK